MIDEGNDAIFDRMEDGIFDVADVRVQLQCEVDHLGSQAAFCRKFGTSRPDLSNILAGKTAPHGRFLDALGFRAVTVYIDKNDQRFATTPTKRRSDVQERWRVARSIAATRRATEADRLAAEAAELRGLAGDPKNAPLADWLLDRAAFAERRAAAIRAGETE